MGACALFLWFCYEEGDGSNVITFLYGGGVMEKAIVEGDFFPLFKKIKLCGAFSLIC
jgi:hypothetical protein